MTKTNKFIFLFSLILIFYGTAYGTDKKDLVSTADKDWLDLVRRYTSADNVKFQPNEWDTLVNEKLGGKPEGNLLAQWWESFDDEILTDLIQKAFRNNPDVENARERVIEAREQLGITKSGLAPKVDGRITWTKSGNEDISDYDYYLGFDASWEIDFSGQKKDNINAAKAAYEAEYYSLHNAWVSLSAEVAFNYFYLRTLQKRLKVAENNIKIQSDILYLVESQYEAGLKDELSVLQAKYVLGRTQSAMPALIESIENNLNSLALLTGELPGSLNERLSAPKNLPEIEISRLVGIPAETLRQRPDIKAAERNFAAQKSRKKAAEKDYYPVISLTGSIFDGKSKGYKFLSSITWPIFHSSEIRKNIRVQSSRERQLLTVLEKTILNAVKEVRDAITANVQEEQKNNSLKESLISAQNAFEVAKDKYMNGLSDFQNVLLALQALYSFEDECIISDGQRILNLIILFKVLGGGWQPLGQ